MSVTEENLDLPSAQAIGASKSVIEKIAEHFSLAFNFDPMKSNIFELVESLDCKVNFVDSTQRDLLEMGTLEVKSMQNWSVFIPSHSSPLDDRFTIAHELGHFVLHSQMGLKPIRAFRRFRSDDVPSKAEVEADAFALAMLMPRDMVQQKVKELGSDESVIAGLFGVDKDAARIRLKWIESAAV